jgi:hypothetical protein
MRPLGMCKALGTVLLVQAAISFGAAPAGAPAGTTGLCKDGSYYSGPTKKGACKGHKGVKEWYGAPTDAAPAKPAAAPPPAATPATPPAAPAIPAAAAKTPAQAATSTGSSTKVAAAPGGGADKVWVNKSSKVYHCPGTRWYGKTKEGEYMSEAEATSQGFKADHGKACK